LIFDVIQGSVRARGHRRQGQADDEPLWTAQDLARVGVLPDDEVAREPHLIRTLLQEGPYQIMRSVRTV